MRGTIASGFAVGWLAIASGAGATPMEVRLTGAVIDGSDQNANTYGALDLAGLPAVLRFFYDSDALPADTDSGPSTRYETAGLPSFLTGSLEIGGIEIPLDLRGSNLMLARDFAGGFLDELAFEALFTRSIVIHAEEIVQASIFHGLLYPAGVPYDPSRELDVDLVQPASRGSGRVRLYDDPACVSCPPNRFTDDELHLVDVSLVFGRAQVLRVPEPASLVLLAPALAAAFIARPRARARGAS